MKTALFALILIFSISASAKDLKCPVLLGPALSEQDRELIRKHAIFNYAQNLEHGKNITFNSAFFDAQKVSNYYKGEKIQMQFVLKYLSFLFPRALYSSHDSTYIEDDIKSYKKKNKKMVQLTLADAGESANDQNRDDLLKKGLLLPMHRVKPANTQLVEVDRDAIRKKLGIAPGKRVLHNYIRSPGTFVDVTARQAVHADESRQYFASIANGFDADITILSFGNIEKRAWGAENGYARAHGAETVFKLSEVTPEKIKNAKGKILIINNTVGRMTELHAAADLTVVAGPVNFFEPLTVQTPTLIFYRTGAVGRNNELGYYDKDIYAQQIELAEKSGGVMVAKNFSEVPDALKALAKVKRENIEDMSSHAKKEFLDALLTHLRYSVERYSEADYERAGLRN